jgi:tetratricopeptide (TPR) repeat protein
MQSARNGPETSGPAGAKSDRAPGPRRGAPEPSGPPEPQAEWIRVDDLRDEAEGAVARGGTPPVLDAEPERFDEEALRRQLGKAVGPAKLARVEKRLQQASRELDREHFAEAARILKPLSEQAPAVSAVRELYGITLYRQGKWRLAARELEAFRALTDSTEQNPVLADCYRALRQWNLVDGLWEELRAASPAGPIVTEGRIVTAGALADRGRVPDAIRLLAGGWSFPKRPKTHHLRRAYALADLYERAGELPRARELFERVRAADPGFADVGARLRNLR